MEKKHDFLMIFELSKRVRDIYEACRCIERTDIKNYGCILSNVEAIRFKTQEINKLIEEWLKDE